MSRFRSRRVYMEFFKNRRRELGGSSPKPRRALGVIGAGRKGRGRITRERRRIVLAPARVGGSSVRRGAGIGWLGRMRPAQSTRERRTTGLDST